jgi:hypothetical protein
MIAYVMLYSVTVAAPLALAAALIASMLRRHGRPERFVWLAALAFALALPLMVLLRPPATGGVPSGPSPEPAATGVIGLPTVLVVPDAGAEVPFGTVLVGAWLLASALLLSRLGVAAPCG